MQLRSHGLKVALITATINKEGYRRSRKKDEFGLRDVSCRIQSLKSQDKYPKMPIRKKQGKLISPPVQEKTLQILELINMVTGSQMQQTEKLSIITRIGRGEITTPLYVECTEVDGKLCLEQGNIAVPLNQNVRVELSKEQIDLILNNLALLHNFISKVDSKVDMP